ncbi:hypothetical protein ACP4OV_022254 [Aristida adscensionis]
MAAIVGKEEPLELEQGSKVFSKLFSRESSAAAPSFRVYYGVASAGSVPFLWESQPGTPKNDAVSTDTLPPLTPPPSYYAAAKATILAAILPKIVLHRRSRSSSLPSSTPSSATSSCSSSSSSSWSWSSASFRGEQSPACSSMRSRIHAFSVVGDDNDDDDDRAPPPTCFSSVRHESFRALKGCRVAVTVRSALASVAGGGHGSAAAAAAAAAQKV